ncbi:MAG: nucleotidyltransferase domain-containing protein [Limnochordaceae bacterium]|nr:nucleotidyltransferase domain-containing protein [Limnochordaceae bacterium]
MGGDDRVTPAEKLSAGQPAAAEGIDGIRERLQAFFAQERTVAAAYVFGSRAAGCPRPHSDVDIAVILPAGLEAEAAFWERVRLMGRLEDALHPLPVDVVDLERVPPLFAHEIIHSSVLLCEHDRDRRVLVEAARQAEYLDFYPYLRYYRKEVLGLDSPGTDP